jgi:sugar/nucleoside kinase (ribokinase family)
MNIKQQVKNKTKVVIIGPVCRDKIILKDKTHNLTGSVLYYAGNALHALGMNVTYFGSYGKDDSFPALKGKMVHLPAQGTIVFVNEYPTDNPDERIQRAIIPDNIITADDVGELDAFDYVVFGPLFHNNIHSSLFEKLHKAKITTILGAQGMIRYLDGEKIIWKNQENILTVLPFIDYLILDDKELEFLTQSRDLLESAKKLRSRGNKNLVVTHGSLGSTLFIKDKIYQIPAFPPRAVVDPTGAGDSYLAGFVKGLSLDGDLNDTGRFAAMTATMAIENKGPFDKTAGDVIQRLGR